MNSKLPGLSAEDCGLLWDPQITQLNSLCSSSAKNWTGQGS